jgi:hypothetical protein
MFLIAEPCVKQSDSVVFDTFGKTKIETRFI